MDEKEDIGFFGDVKSFLLKLLIGLAPMATLVPLILNKTHSILGISYDTSYIIFTALYFTLPVLLIFSWIWYKLFFRNRREPASATAAEDAPRSSTEEFELNTRTYWQILSFLLVVIILMSFAFHFIFTQWLSSVFIGACIIALLLLIPLVCVTAIDYKHIHLAVEHDVSKSGIRAHEKLHAGLIQYAIFTLLLVVAVGIFTFHFSPGPESPDTPRKHIHKYVDALKIEQDSTKGYQSKLRNIEDSLRLIYFRATIKYDGSCPVNDTIRNDIFISMRPGLDSTLASLFRVLDSVYRLLPDAAWNSSPDINPIDNPPYYYQSCTQSISRSGTQLLERVDSLLNSHAAPACIPKLQQLQDYSLDQVGSLVRLLGNYRDKLNDSTREKWSLLLKRIQFYCFLLFGTGMLWLLTLWFYYYIHAVYRERTQEAITHVTTPGDPAQDSELILGPIRTGIMVLLLLSIPFLRSFDKTSIDLTNPFLHFSLFGLAQASSEPPRTETNIYYGPTNRYIDSSKNYFPGQSPITSDSSLHTILRHVDSSIKVSRREHKELNDEIKRTLIP
jgi:hypothetical protein